LPSELAHGEFSDWQLSQCTGASHTGVANSLGKIKRVVGIPPLFYAQISKLKALV
jgi:hypothetical protein